MLYALLFLVVGIIIGWNWQQPPWARELQERVVGTVRSFTNKTKENR
ncbi:hypothetical protein [Marichromatium bheemlicum]|uniref:Uncharacterized protein n=1 Tax=Marichromatium bheemlicum TaxID=365339 RepID=A0ABX1ICR2_9GAMM|nr:hypothetical protein [Marichromatium bheemlicum]NKN33876.1 hypothetical protein [Marichromatium bheemlicum]